MRRVISKSIVCIVSLTVVILLIGNSLPAATTQGSPGSSASTGTVDIKVRIGGENGQAGLVADFFGIGCLALLDFLVALVHLRLMPIVRDEFPPQHYRQLQEDSIVVS